METEPDWVVVLYHRTPNEFTFTGQVVAKEDATTFKSLDFAQMVEVISQTLRKYPERRLILKRDESPYPSTMPQEIVDLIRTDPAEATRQLSMAPVTVVVGRAKEQKLSRTLRHGHDTLADAFGEMIYVRVMGPKYESPITGRWEELPVENTPIPLLEIANPFSSGYTWAALSTEVLLLMGRERYYLPRTWNPSGGWISHEDLSRLFNNYIEETRKCLTKELA